MANRRDIQSEISHDGAGKMLPWFHAWVEQTNYIVNALLDSIGVNGKISADAIEQGIETKIAAVVRKEFERDANGLITKKTETNVDTGDRVREITSTRDANGLVTERQIVDTETTITQTITRDINNNVEIVIPQIDIGGFQ